MRIEGAVGIKRSFTTSGVNGSLQLFCKQDQGCDFSYQKIRKRI
jgi:hypothetical protein